MTASFIRLCITAAILIIPLGVGAQVIEEIDAYWDHVSDVVKAGDYEGYGDLFHPDAVLVLKNAGTSQLITHSLIGAEPEFAANRAPGASASVAFRFTQRLHDEFTAHETGIFRYANKPSGGTETVAFVHFDALMVKKDGRWWMLMEYQRERATQEEWDRLR